MSFLEKRKYKKNINKNKEHIVKTIQEIVINEDVKLIDTILKNKNKFVLIEEEDTQND